MNSPGVLSHPCLQWALGSLRLSSASHGIVARNRPRSSSPLVKSYPVVAKSILTSPHGINAATMTGSPC